MRKHILLILMLLLSINNISWAESVFSFTAMIPSLQTTDGGSAQETFNVTNNSGTTETITNVKAVPDPSGTISESINTIDTTCTDGDVIANGGSCTLGINVSGEKVAEGEIQVNVCSYGGQLCSQLAAPIPVTVVAAGSSSSIPCSGTTPTCRLFLSSDSVFGDLSRSEGNVDISSCAANFSGLTEGNCICEKEAAAESYGHPGSWRAWLSTGSRDAKDNISYSAAATYTKASDGTTIASPGALITPAAVPEAQISNLGLAYTGTSATGVAAAGTCTNWTTKIAEQGQYGEANAVTNTNWTAAEAQSCTKAAQLYCFEAP